MGKKIEIIFVTQNLAPFRIDWLDELTSYFDVQIFYYMEDDLRGNTNPKYMLRKPKKAKYSRISGKNFMARSYNCLQEIRQIYTKESIIILDGYGFKEQMILVMLLRKKGLQYALSIDGIVPGNQKSSLKQLVKKVIWNNAEFILSTSVHTDRILKEAGVERDRILPHIFTSLYQKDVIAEAMYEKKEQYKEKMGFKDKFVILSVGKMIPSKGFMNNLVLAKRNPEVDFVIVGGQPTNEYKAFVEMNKIQNVLFVDFCNKEELKQYYYAADVFFHPTKTDVWGLVINEALAYGLPVVTTDKCVAGISMITENENGFIVPVDDVDLMEKKLKYLYNDLIVRKKIFVNNICLARENTIEKSAEMDFVNITKWKG